MKILPIKPRLRGMTVKPLAVDKLCLKTDPTRLAFETTAELSESDGPVGQARAMRAITFGVRMAQPGYNIFVAGPQGSGKHTSVRRALEKTASTMPPPPDWCYVHNFGTPHRPIPLRFAAGAGAVFKEEMRAFVEELGASMPRLFESDRYRERREAIETEFRDTVDAALATLRRKAETQGLALVERADGGVTFVPQRDGLALSDEDYRRLSKEEREYLAEKIKALQADLERVFEKLGQVRDRAVGRLKALDRELGEAEIRRLLSPLVRRHADHDGASRFLKSLAADVLKHLDALQDGARGEHPEGKKGEGVPFHHYQVNLLVDNSDTPGAPVVTLRLPSLSQLVGKVEHVPLLMTMVTDFMFVKPGALHQANGGFLLVDALELLEQPVSWEALKRALKDRRIRIENLAEMLDRTAMVTIQPDPIPLDAKVILFGEPHVYYALRRLDPDFGDLFKVQADFETAAERTPEIGREMLQLLASVARADGVRHLDRSGAARMIDAAARIAGDAEKISVRTGPLADLLREADHFAGEAGRALIAAADVGQALAAKEDRAGRFKALEQELIARDIVFIDTDGARAGQVNAITVLAATGYAFGVPARITARVGPGTGNVVDIERASDFSGRSHTKGVHILTGYLNGTFSAEGALSLAASIAFEQSYGPIDGDSASAAELAAILSAIADVPLKQAIGITGSIDQHGQMQAIGGVNEKIEGFFDICAMRGLGRHHGVVIPKANLHNLMLRDDVVAAAEAGTFSIYAAETIGEALEVLTGMKAGAQRRDGSFPRGTFNRKVADTLHHFARPRILRPIRPRGGWFAWL